jgi:hypothetical protein
MVLMAWTPHAGTDRRAPTHELTRAARFLALRRRVDRQAPDTVLSRDSLLALVGRPTDDAEFETTTIRSSGEGRGPTASPSAQQDTADTEKTVFAEIDAVLERSRRYCQVNL